MIAIKPPQANESVDIARGGDLPVLADGERAHSDAAVAGEGWPDGRRIAWIGEVPHAHHSIFAGGDQSSHIPEPNTSNFPVMGFDGWTERYWMGSVVKLPQVNCPVNQADRKYCSVRSKSNGVRARGFQNWLTERRRMIEVSEIPEATFLVFATTGQRFSVRAERESGDHITMCGKNAGITRGDKTGHQTRPCLSVVLNSLGSDTQLQRLEWVVGKGSIGLGDQLPSGCDTKLLLGNQLLCLGGALLNQGDRGGSDGKNEEHREHGCGVPAPTAVSANAEIQKIAGACAQFNILCDHHSVARSKTDVRRPFGTRLSWCQTRGDTTCAGGLDGGG